MFKKTIMIGIILFLCVICNASAKEVSTEYGNISYDTVEKIYYPDNVKLYMPKNGSIDQFDCISAKGEYQWVSDGVLLKGMWCNTANMKTEYKYNQYLILSNMQYENVFVFIPDKKILGYPTRNNDDKYIIFDLDITEK